MGRREKNIGISADKVSKRNEKECVQIMGSAACHLLNGKNIILRIHQNRSENVRKRESRTRDDYKRPEELKTIKLLNKK
jgi:hypothetical protein